MASKYKFTVEDLNAMMSEASGDALPKPSIKGFKSKLGLKDTKTASPVATETPGEIPEVEGE